jgi:hypothetical protein
MGFASIRFKKPSKSNGLGVTLLIVWLNDLFSRQKSLEPVIRFHVDGYRFGRHFVNLL